MGFDEFNGAIGEPQTGETGRLKTGKLDRNTMPLSVSGYFGRKPQDVGRCVVRTLAVCEGRESAAEWGEGLPGLDHALIYRRLTGSAHVPGPENGPMERPLSLVVL